MGYSIGEVANLLGMSAHTLRFYDKEGLLPFVQKTSSGIRVFSDSDIEWLILINCLKGTNMPLKDIKKYIDLFLEGDETMPQRLEMLKEQKVKLDEQLKEMNGYMDKINYKVEYYEKLIAGGKRAQIEAKNHIENERKRLVSEKERKKA